MPVTLERIETAGPDRRARRLVFSDPFAEPRLTALAVVRALDLEEGSEIDPTELETRLATCELSCARERALRVLGHRDRSAHELDKRLKDDGYPSASRQAVLARLEELGLIDDGRFADSWVRARTAAGFGPQRIRKELRDKGVADEVAAAALDRFADADSVTQARRALGAARIESRADRERALRKLLRKGFDLGTALKAIDDDGDPDAT